MMQCGSSFCGGSGHRRRSRDAADGISGLMFAGEPGNSTTAPTTAGGFPASSTIRISAGLRGGAALAIGRRGGCCAE